MPVIPDVAMPAGKPEPSILEGRIWVDGCWDFFHHGHAGAILQARQLGNELFVGVHSDESIMENKGPTVMTLEERIIAVNACKWVTRSIPNAPYVTSLPWISHYGCKYVVHGDDITTDSNGQDCYRYVKAAGRFQIVKRTPSISTTDLVGRMLLCTRSHFINSLHDLIETQNAIPDFLSINVKEQIQAFATDHTGLKVGSTVWSWIPSPENRDDHLEEARGRFTPLTHVIIPKSDQKIIYVDGSFDLFSSGHIEFLRQVVETEEKKALDNGWYKEEAIKERIKINGVDHAPIHIIAGIHEDAIINRWRGLNYPIMNILERALCVLQCKYVNSIIVGAPIFISNSFLNLSPYGIPNAVYHGPTSSVSLPFDPYFLPKERGIYHEIGDHDYSGVNATQICQRILKSRDLYEERQRLKYLKSINEKLPNDSDGN